MEEKQEIALEVEASEKLTGAEIVERAEAMGASFAVVADQGSAVGVLVVSELAQSPKTAVEAARDTPAITEHSVPVDLPGGETLEVDVQVQGADLAVWDRGHERLVMSLGGRGVAAALNAHVMSFAASDITLPGTDEPLEPRYYTYVCARKHYDRRAINDPDRTCRKCGRPIYRI